MSGWATGYISALNEGRTVKFRPKGNSMTPRIKSGELVTVEPVQPENVIEGDVVLCEIGRTQYLHLVKAVDRDGNRIRFTIGNNHGRINGRTSRVYGKLIRVEP